MIEVPVRNNWYQRDGFWPSTFAMVVTVNEDGSHNIAPYQFAFPWHVADGDHSLVLVARSDSRTVENLERDGLCSLNYVEYDEALLPGIMALGNPRLERRTKAELNPFHVNERSHVIGAAQVFDCSHDATRMSDYFEHGRTAYVHLSLDAMYLAEQFADRLTVPRLPITYGYRDGGFWFAEPGEPFRLPVVQR